MSDSETSLSCTPPELRQIAENATSDLLPKKSREIYEKEFKNFDIWCTQNKVTSVSENILLAYFEIQSKKKKSSTLWSIYSMLRSCINIYKNIDISQYTKLQAFLKRLSEGYEAKKSQILQAEDIDRFIQEANDVAYLATKVCFSSVCIKAVLF